jgi:hypothetical protein
MKTKLIIGFIALALSTSAFAGVAEKKAKRKLIESTDSNLSSTQKKCGNSAMKVEFDFDKYKAFMKANAAKLGTKHFAYSYADRNTFQVLTGISDLCKDADYKEEIGKLKTIKVMPNSNYDDQKSNFKLSEDGKTLTAVLQTNSGTRSYSDYVKQMKAAW